MLVTRPACSSEKPRKVPSKTSTIRLMMEIHMAAMNTSRDTRMYLIKLGDFPLPFMCFLSCIP